MRRRAWPFDPRFVVVDDGSIIGPSGRTLTTFLGHQGYPRFNRYAAGRWSQHFVHVVVCETFHGPRPDGHEVAHENGDQLDVRAVNLSWKSHADNEADKVRHDTRAWGERHGMRKLTEVAVRAIRSSAESSRVAGLRYGVAPSTIRSIRRRESWRHVA